MPMPYPSILKIVTYGETEFNLLYCDERGDWMSDTFHRSLQEAMGCALEEYGVSVHEWELK